MSQTHTIGRTATRVYTEEGITRVIYHSTPVVSFDSTSIILNTGGWKTATTKLRMNQTSSQFNLGYTVFQKNFEWFISYKEKIIPFDSMKIIFYRN